MPVDGIVRTRKPAPRSNQLLWTKTIRNETGKRSRSHSRRTGLRTDLLLRRAVQVEAAKSTTAESSNACKPAYVLGACRPAEQNQNNERRQERCSLAPQSHKPVPSAG